MTAKRIRLYREGHPTNDGRLLPLNSTTWREPVLPVVVRPPGSLEARVVGSVSQMRRERETGWITGLVRVPFSLRGAAAEADFDSVDLDEEKSTDDLIYLKTARLTMVTIGRNPAWDGMEN